MNITFKVGFLSALLVGGLVSAAATERDSFVLAAYPDYVVTMSVPEGKFEHKKQDKLTQDELAQARDRRRYMELSRKKTMSSKTKDYLTDAETAEYEKLGDAYRLRHDSAYASFHGTKS